MPSLPTDLPTDLLQALEKLVATLEVQGLVLIGSRSRGYHDSNADYDLEIIVDDPFYEGLVTLQTVALVWDGKPYRSRLLGDLLTLSRRELEARRGSPLDNDHWPYEEAVVWYDREGEIAPLIADLGRFPPELWETRLRIHYADLWHEIARARQAERHERDVNLGLLLGRAVQIYLKFIFVLNRRWPPPLYRAEEALQHTALPHRPASDLFLLQSATSTHETAPLQQLYDSLGPLLDSFGITWHRDRESLIVSVFGPTYRRDREKWSRY